MEINMKNRMSRNAGIIIALISVIMILGIYTVFGRVDLVYKKDGYELYRQEDVCFFSAIDDPYENTDGKLLTQDGEQIKLLYVDQGEKHVYGETPVRFRVRICKTVLKNLLFLNWEDKDQVIVITAEK